ALAMMMMTTTLAISMQPASAGWNGQKVRFQCHQGLDEVWFYGQDPDFDTQSWYTNLGGASQAYNSNLWWEGNLNIVYTLSADQDHVRHTDNFQVPTVYWSDIYEVNCSP